jgi:hypothetical protein
MLIDFQQALVDLTASPELCSAVRSDPAVLRSHYQLTEREFNRIVAIVRQPGMVCACVVYRANRLAPLAMNVPRTCRALGSELSAIVSEYWAKYPEGNVHFYIETDRFCHFLRSKLESGAKFSSEVASVLAEESMIVANALMESKTEIINESIMKPRITDHNTVSSAE